MTVLLDEDGELSSEIGVRGCLTYVYYDATGQVATAVPSYANRETDEARLVGI